MLSAHSIHVLYDSLLMQAPTGQCRDDTKPLCLVTCIALTRLYRAIDWLHKLLIQQRQHISQKQPSCIALVRAHEKWITVEKWITISFLRAMG